MKTWKKEIAALLAVCCFAGTGVAAQEAKFIQIDGGFGLKDDGTVWKLPVLQDKQLGMYLFPEQYDYKEPSETISMIQLPEFTDAVKISAAVEQNTIPCNLAVLNRDGTLWNRKAIFKRIRYPDRRDSVYEPDCHFVQLANVAEVYAGDALTMATKQDGSVWIWGLLHNGYYEHGTAIDTLTIPAQEELLEPKCVEGIRNPRCMDYRFQTYQAGVIITEEGKYQAFESTRGYSDGPEKELTAKFVDAQYQEKLDAFRFREMTFGNSLDLYNIKSKGDYIYRVSRPENRRIGILEDGRLFVDFDVVEEMEIVKVVDLGEVGDVIDKWDEMYAPFAHYVAVKEDGTVWESGCLFPYLKKENGYIALYTENWYPIRGLEHVVDIDVIGGNILALREDGTIINWCPEPQIVSTETPQPLQGRYCAFQFSTERETMVYNDDVYEIDPGRGTKPVELYGRTYLPIRNLVEKAGGTVEWVGETGTVTARLWDHEVQMQLGSSTVTVDGEEHAMDAAPFEENGRTMVPVRFLAEGFGFDVEWEESSDTVRLYYKELLGVQ